MTRLGRFLSNSSFSLEESSPKEQKEAQAGVMPNGLNQGFINILNSGLQGVNIFVLFIENVHFENSMSHFDTLSLIFKYFEY